ncbi:unnamed protein product [Absidia cylindrospora]
MNNLPAEIVFAIAINVPYDDSDALSLVNRQFNTLANNLLSRYVVISTEQQLMKLLPSSQHGLFQYVCQLIIDYPLTDASFMLLIPLLPPLLNSLELQEAENITDASFKYLPQQCPHLTSLTLSYASITDQSLASVGQHCHQLRTIFLSQCRYLSPHLFAALGACPLEKIYHHGLVTVDDGDDDTPIQTMTHDLVVGFPLLADLIIDQIDGRELVATMMDDATPPWPNLTRFHIPLTSNMTDRDAIAFIHAHPQLKDLELSNNGFSDDVLQVIADTLSGLTFLDLSYNTLFTHHGVRCIVRQCPLLILFKLFNTNVVRTDFTELTRLEQQGPHDHIYFALHGTHLESLRRALAHIDNNDTTLTNI